MNIETILRAKTPNEITKGINDLDNPVMKFVKSFEYEIKKNPKLNIIKLAKTLTLLNKVCVNISTKKINETDSSLVDANDYRKINFGLFRKIDRFKIFDLIVYQKTDYEGFSEYEQIMITVIIKNSFPKKIINCHVY